MAVIELTKQNFQSEVAESKVKGFNRFLGVLVRAMQNGITNRR